MDPPPKDVLELKRKGNKKWQFVNTEKKDLCEEAVHKIKRRLMTRGILIKPIFRNFDTLVSLISFVD